MREFSNENKDHGTESSEYSMDDFRQEIQGLIDENMRLRSEGKKWNPHFCNPGYQMKVEYLTEADKETFSRFKKATKTMDDTDINKFHESVKGIEGDAKPIDDLNEEEMNRLKFYGYLVNEGMTFTVARLEKEMERRKKDKAMDSESSSE